VGRAWGASNLRASQCSLFASQFGPHRCAAGKTRRSSLPGRRPRSGTSDDFHSAASKYLRPREVVRGPRGAFAAEPFLACHFSPLGVSAQNQLSGQRQGPICAGQDRVGPKSNVRFGSKAIFAAKFIGPLDFVDCTPISVGDAGCVDHFQFWCSCHSRRPEFGRRPTILRRR